MVIVDQIFSERRHCDQDIWQRINWRFCSPLELEHLRSLTWLLITTSMWIAKWRITNSQRQLILFLSHSYLYPFKIWPQQDIWCRIVTLWCVFIVEYWMHSYSFPQPLCPITCSLTMLVTNHSMLLRSVATITFAQGKYTVVFSSRS